MIRFAVGWCDVQGFRYANNVRMFNDEEESMLGFNEVEASLKVFYVLHREMGDLGVGDVYRLRWRFTNPNTDFLRTPDDLTFAPVEEFLPPRENGEDGRLVEMRYKLEDAIRNIIWRKTQLLPMMMCSYVHHIFTLGAAGYFITNENREETYLKIISTGDDALIDTLADFLEEQDQFDKCRPYVDVYNKAMRELKKAKDVDELFKIYHERIEQELNGIG